MDPLHDQTPSTRGSTSRERAGEHRHLRKRILVHARRAGLLLLACGFMCGGTATATTINWYQQGGCGGYFAGSNWDCSSQSTGDSGYNNALVVNTAVTNFIPNGDCQTYAPNCHGGYDTNEYPGLAPNAGTWCTDQSGTVGSVNNCSDQGDGAWTLNTGPSYGDTCQCGIHIEPTFGTWGASNDYPFYFSSSNFILGVAQADQTLNGGPFHAYLCFDINTSDGTNWVEDCEYTYRTVQVSSDKSGVYCNGNSLYVDNFFNSNGSDPYGTNLGTAETIGNNSGLAYFSFGTTSSQLTWALAVANTLNGNTGCGGHKFNTNPAAYHLSSLESGIENWSSAGTNNAFQTEWNLSAITNH